MTEFEYLIYYLLDVTFLKVNITYKCYKMAFKQVLYTTYLGKIYVSKITTFLIRNLNMLYFTDFKTVYSILEIYIL